MPPSRGKFYEKIHNFTTGAFEVEKKKKHEERKTSDLVHTGSPAPQMPSSLMREANTGSIKV